MVKLKDRKSSIELMPIVELSEDIMTLVRRSRLRWYGSHFLLRRNEQLSFRQGAYNKFPGFRQALQFEVECVTGMVVRAWDGENRWRKTK